MGLSSKFKPGIVALVAVGVVVQLATALPQIEREQDIFGFGFLTVSSSGMNCEAVATALNSLKYGSSSITDVGCPGYYDFLSVSGSENCEAVATALNSLKYRSSSITGFYCTIYRDTDYTLYTDEPKDVELLNTLLAFSVEGYSAIDVGQAADLADVKNVTANAAADLADVKDVTATTAADLAVMKDQLADLKALLTPECTANRLARAQGNPAADPANSSDRKTNIAAIVVPIVAVLLVAAIAATVLVMKGRGADAYAEVERRAANVPPATTQPNPAFTPADAADAVPEPGSDEVQSTA